MSFSERVPAQDTASGVPQQDFATRVLRGAAWLDTVRPGWAGLVDVETLDMENGTRCALGQLFAEEAKDSDAWCGYWWARDAHFQGGQCEAAEHGFSLFGEEEECDCEGLECYYDRYRELTQLWTKVIESRRAA